MQNLIATTFEVVHYIALQAVHYKPLQEVHLSRYNQVKTPKTELTSHTARRTFVVTALNEGVELDLIAQINSHSAFDNMRPYIASTRKGKQMVIDALDSATEA